MRYDPFQKNAINAIKQGHSVIVSAPTGAGKTVIAEHVITDCLRAHKKAVYTAPIKALSNQKFRDFKQDFPDKIGILTGDVSINAHAPILIMTTEIFRNKVLHEHDTLQDYSWIIFDEIHYLDDYERGSVWEESLIFLPDHMNILALSATIPNIDELAGWLESIHKKPLTIIQETTRPVPLHFGYQCQGEVIDTFKRLKKVGFHHPYPVHHHRSRHAPPMRLKPNRPTSLIKHISGNDLLPCIYFVFSRRRTEYLADEIRRFNFLNAEEKKKISEMYTSLCDHFDLNHEKSALALKDFIERGIAYHHAGMLPTLKEAVERLFTSRLIKVIFTTETFALGINMPARTVIFDELRKFYGRSFGALKTRDFYQMAGRAGRRSIDTEGFVFSRVNPRYITYNELHDVIYGNPEKVLSRFNASYATLLNLYQKYQDKLTDIYPRSFHFYQQKKKFQKKAIAMMEAKVQLLKQTKCIHKKELTEKGLFAAKLYGYELVLSELYTRGVLETLDTIALGVLCLGIVFEPRKNMSAPRLTGPARMLAGLTDDITHSIHKMERKLGIKPMAKKSAFHMSTTITSWMHGDSFDTILEYTGVDEGEIIRYFRMTLQVLREIKETPISNQLMATINTTIHAINRDIIDAEKQLRG